MTGKWPARTPRSIAAKAALLAMEATGYSRRNGSFRLLGIEAPRVLCRDRHDRRDWPSRPDRGVFHGNPDLGCDVKESIVKPTMILISGLLAGVAMTADGSEAIPTAQDASAAAHAAAESRPYKHRISFPAGALSYFPGSTAISQREDGLHWSAPTGSVTLTVRRPLDYSGGNVRVSLLHAVGDEGDGDLWFGITPVGFSHGNFFETYDGVATDSIPAPMITGDVLLQQSAVVPPTGPFATGDWWYFSISRNGAFSGRLTLLSVSLDYY